jgi:hypothetical protein
MANEVVITYWKAADTSDGFASGIFGEPVGGEVTDIGTRSVQFSGEIVRVTAKGTGFWYRFGRSDVSAAANTDGNGYLQAGESVDIEVTSASNYVDTAADA